MTPYSNPYVGPRTFSEKEASLFFGREREARDLTARIVSERLLLFYAQSGAGKSSLLNARIIPNLRDEEGFQVLPVGRVSGELPPGAPAVDNIFAFNLMASLDQSGESPARLAAVSLSDFLARLAREPGVDADGRPAPCWIYKPELLAPNPAAGPRFVLIIDQFEEIITSHPGRWQEREDFFRQLNQALVGDPALWAVLTLREDYVAALDPYAESCFNRLRARFYMERMKVDAALEAIRNPADKGGRPFAPGVAEQLAHNLSQVRVPGQTGTVAGQYVEPVQLQVACYQLWENIKDRLPGLITSADLVQAGDVDQALTKFYEETLAATLAHAAAMGVTERQLRSWFDEELITEAGTRAAVFRNEVSGYTGSIPNALVDVLARQFLLRTELRAGGAWVELVHDRLVRPVSSSNVLWSEQHLSTLQRRAAIWQQEGRPDEMLLKDDSLDEAERWVKAHTSEMETHERDFLAASQQERAKAAYLVRQARRLRILAISATVLSILAIVAAVLAWQQYGQADRARTAARMAEQAALDKEGVALKAKEEAEQQRRVAETAKDNAKQAEKTAVEAKENAETQRRLAEAAAETSMRVEKEAKTEALAGAALLELSRRRLDDAALMALAAGEQAVELDLDSPLVTHAIRRSFELSPPGERLSPRSNSVSQVSWLQSGQRQLLAVGDMITILDANSGEALRRFSTPNRRLRAVDAAGQRLLLTGVGPDLNGGVLEIWSLEQEKVVMTLSGHNGQVQSAAWSPDGTKIISGGGDETARVWDATTGQGLYSLTGHKGTVYTVGWSPDGTQVFTGAWDGTSRVWDAKTGVLTATFEVPHDPSSLEYPVNAVAWSNIDEAIYIGYDDPVIRIWYPLADSVAPLPPAHTDRIRSISIRPVASDQLLTVGSDGLAVLWDTRVPVKRFTWFACTGPGYSISWHPDGNKVLIGCEDGTVRAWSLQQHQDRRVLRNHLHWVWGVAWSPDGKMIATSSQDKYVRIWNVSSGEEIAKSSDLTGESAQALDVAWRPDSREILSGHNDGVARIWRPDDGVLLAEFVGGHLAGSRGGVRSVAWNHKGTRFATGGNDGRVLIWDRYNVDKPLRQITPLGSRIFAIAWSPDDGFLAYGGDDGYLRIRDTENSGYMIELDTRRGIVANQRALSSIAWRSGEERDEVAVGLSDGFLQIWDPQTRTLIRELQIASGGVEDIAWSPDAAMLASGSWDGTVRVWDTDSWRETTELEGHAGVVQAVDWSPDGSRIVTGSRDWTARIWIIGNDLMRAELLRRVCTNSVSTEMDIKAMIPNWSSCEQRLAEPEVVRLLARFDSIVAGRP